ncbi:hypothetical protein [Longimicrobium sp.]|uniref:hypothetical protein n=1 Tax=Longimicrobium sp. TaxID=2029185 RepID=UPI002E36D69B|nr:hypothetical protein [Longimicrobium sp.]HEX6036653.1 hypothetical protein [Longimicrobium sp.]
MTPQQSRKQQITRVAGELSAAIKRQARGRWRQVRTAERNESGRHVWRFMAGPGTDARFLHIEHRAMVQGKDASARLLEQLSGGRWMDLLQQGPGNSVLLTRDGELTAYPQA